MKANYSYPINTEWNTEELVAVMTLWQVLEDTYESQVLAEDFLATYASFKQVVKSIGEERQLGKEFEEMSGYSLYHVVKLAREQQTGRLKVKGK